MKSKSVDTEHNDVLRQKDIKESVETSSKAVYRVQRTDVFKSDHLEVSYKASRRIRFPQKKVCSMSFVL